jgi:CIC family chloride channel protein
MILFGWPGRSGTNELLFGSVIDRVISNPPADIAILRYRPVTKFNKLLVPIAGGPNGRLAVNLALAVANNTPEDTKIILTHVAVGDIDPTQAEARAQSAFRYAAHGLDHPFETMVVSAESPTEGILKASKSCDLIVIGATKEQRFRNLLMGNVAQSVADGAHCPVIIVKRQSTIIDAVLRETILSPIRKSDKLAEAQERAKEG